jgi:hypothetical protein
MPDNIHAEGQSGVQMVPAPSSHVGIHMVPSQGPLGQRIPHPPVAPGQQIVFYGEVFANPSRNKTFAVLAGEGAPTVTGGYPKVQVIDRPQRIGLTVFQGYDPFTIDVPIRFNLTAGGRLVADRARTPGIAIERRSRSSSGWRAAAGRVSTDSVSRRGCTCRRPTRAAIRSRWCRSTSRR